MTAAQKQEASRRRKDGESVADLAGSKGVKMGRKPILTPHQNKEARERIANGEKTRDLAASYGVSRSTISRLCHG